MKLINNILEYLFPLRNTYRLVAALSPDQFKAKGSVYTTGRITYLLEFADPEVRACVHEAKFHANEKAYTLLAGVVRQYFETHYQTPKKDYLVIPIPLSRERQRERGYNQVTKILKKIDLPRPSLETSLLIRVRHTDPQTSLERSKRLRNTANAFSVNRRKVNLIKDAHVLLIDDVVTTGATLGAAKAVLLPHSPASVTCIALAH